MHTFIATLVGLISVAAALKCNIPCNRMYKPVCGHDAKTYSNECMARYASCKSQRAITIVADKDCKKIGVSLASPRICTADYRPVCGSDGKTYANECQLRSAAAASGRAISIVEKKECDKLGDGCLLKCTFDFRPVCGSDRRKYPNECQMRLTACQSKQAIIAVSNGMQSDCKTCNIACTREYRPVCGSDGVTYGNECGLKAAACETRRAITKVQDGKCEFNRACNIGCPRNLRPVCGSNGKKYDNECLLKVAACKEGVAISVVRDAQRDTDCSECNRACTREYKPVCGSDGKTYPNKCEMRSKACTTKTAIIKVVDGKCK